VASNWQCRACLSWAIDEKFIVSSCFRRHPMWSTAQAFRSVSAPKAMHTGIAVGPVICSPQIAGDLASTLFGDACRLCLVGETKTRINFLTPALISGGESWKRFSVSDQCQGRVIDCKRSSALCCVYVEHACTLENLRNLFSRGTTAYYGIRAARLPTCPFLSLQFRRSGVANRRISSSFAPLPPLSAKASD